MQIKLTAHRPQRHLQLCMHCDYNLHYHDNVAANEKERIRKERATHQMLKLFTACTGIAMLSYFITDYLPDIVKPWALALTGVFGLLAFVIMTTPNDQNTRRLRNRHLDVVMDD